MSAVNLFSFIDDELPKIAAIATAGYFLGLRIRGSAPLMAFHTYPQAWIDEYTEKGYVLRDPITTWAMTVGGNIRWNSPLLPDPFGILRRAKAHGLKDGASVAYGPIGSLTICSIARSDRALTDDEIAAVREIVVRLHDAVAIPHSLSAQQKELLAALEGGSRGEELAARLAVTPAGAERAVRDICDALFARTPEEAARRAREYRLL